MDSYIHYLYLHNYLRAQLLTMNTRVRLCEVVITCIAVGWMQTVQGESSNTYPLIMPGVNITQDEVYLCTGVEVGADNRLD